MTERRRTYPLRLRAAEYESLAKQAAAAEQTKSRYILGLIDSQRETDRQLRVSQALGREALAIARAAVSQLRAEQAWRLGMEKRLGQLAAAGLLPFEEPDDIPAAINLDDLTVEQLKKELQR